MTEIKNIYDKVIYTSANPNDTIKQALEQSVKAGVSLQGANLRGAILDEDQHSKLEKQLARTRFDLFQRRAENEVNYRPPSHMRIIDFQRLEEDMRLPVFWNWLLAVVCGGALGGFVLLMLWVLF